MRYLRTFFKRWYLYIIPIVILPAVVTVYGYGKLMLYNSTALLYVDKPVFLSAQDFGWNPYLSPAQNEASSMAELLLSETFVDNIAARTDLAATYNLDTRGGKDQAFARIAPEVAITASTAGPNVLLLSVTDKNPRIAQQVAAALLDGYTAYFEDHRLQLDQQAVTLYTQQLATAQGQLNQATQRVQEYLYAHPGVSAGANTDPQLAQLQQELSQDQAQVNQLNSQLSVVKQDMQATASPGSGLFRVLDAPQVPLQPTIEKKKLLVYTGGGLAAALALIGLIVAGLTQLDRKVYLAADLQAIADSLDLDLPALETLPVIVGIGSGGHADSDVEDDSIDGILMPVLTALPRLQESQMRQGIRRMAGGGQSNTVQAIADAEDRA
jgi:uncharacterized protein involved in exopolysaccharide biosynthesis